MLEKAKSRKGSPKKGKWWKPKKSSSRHSIFLPNACRYLPKRGILFQKRKSDAITLLQGKQKTYSFPVKVNGKEIVCFLDTGATVSAVAKNCLHPSSIKRGESLPLMVGNGECIFSVGTADLVLEFGKHSFVQKAHVVDTTAFSALLGTDFTEGNEHFCGFLTRPPRILIDNEEFQCQDMGAVFSCNRIFRLFARNPTPSRNLYGIKFYVNLRFQKLKSF